MFIMLSKKQIEKKRIRLMSGDHFNLKGVSELSSLMLVVKCLTCLY